MVVGRVLGFVFVFLKSLHRKNYLSCGFSYQLVQGPRNGFIFY